MNEDSIDFAIDVNVVEFAVETLFYAAIDYCSALKDRLHEVGLDWVRLGTPDGLHAGND